MLTGGLLRLDCRSGLGKVHFSLMLGQNAAVASAPFGFTGQPCLNPGGGKSRGGTG